MTMSATYRSADTQLQAIYARVVGGNLGLAQLWFSAAVVDTYRARPGWRVLRTNSVGRVQSPEVWSFDSGIAADGEALQATINDLIQRLPEGERPHWLQHVIAVPTSRTFPTMRRAPGACIGD